MEQTHSHFTPLRWTRADAIAIASLTIVAALVRFIRLTDPPHLVGDEHFYAHDACWYLFSSEDECAVPRETNLEHPPLGKWLIAAGIRMLGNDALGHRIMPAVFGTLCIPLFFLIARRLLRSTFGATLAGGLLAIDFLQFVLSRTAMLDTFLLFFGLLAIYFVTRDRDVDKRGPPWWRYAAGAAAGAATASKWSGLTILLTIAVLGIAWDILDRRRAGARHPFFRSLREEGTHWATAYMLVPLVVYALTFIGRAHGDLLSWPWMESSWINALWDRQTATFKFHAELIWSHRFASDPWEWPLVRRAFPMADRDIDGNKHMIVATGNPVLWTAGFLALVYVVARWIKAPRPKSIEGIIVAGTLLTYLPWVAYFYAPWLFFTWGRVATYVFYLLPTVPFLYLALAYVGVRIARARVGKVVIALTLLFAAGAFAFYLPLMTYLPLSQSALEARTFAFDDCKAPEGAAPFVFPRATTIDGQVTYEPATVPSSHVYPPEGWCWLNSPQELSAVEDPNRPSP